MSAASLASPGETRVLLTWEWWPEGTSPPAPCPQGSDGAWPCCSCCSGSRFPTAASGQGHRGMLQTREDARQILHPTDLCPISQLIIPPRSPESPSATPSPFASPAIPQDPSHRLLHFFQISFGVLVSFLSRNHEALLLPLHVPKDDRAAAVIFVVEDAGVTKKLGARSQPHIVKLLGWELANAFVLAEKRGETEVNKTPGPSQPEASFWAGFACNATVL